MQYTKSPLYDLFKGIFVGIGCIIPGMSGGTAAMAVGVYERLLKALSEIFSSRFKSLLDAVPIAVGAITAIFLLASPLSDLHEKYPMFTNVIFCIITLASTIFFIKNNMSFKFSKVKFIMLLTGIGVSVLFSYIMYTQQINMDSNNPLFLCLIGLILALALVLPGISFSYMLFFFGIYDLTLNAVTDLNLYFLFPLVMGILTGSFLFSKLFLKIINKHSEETYCMILGFVVFSIADILAQTFKC